MKMKRRQRELEKWASSAMLWNGKNTDGTDECFHVQADEIRAKGRGMIVCIAMAQNGLPPTLVG